MTRPLSRVAFPAALLACSLMPLAAHAADPESVVSGTGTATIEKPADTLRLQVQVQADAPTLKEALEKLKTRRDAVKAGLVKLGADEKRCDAGATSVSDGSSPDDRQAALQRAMRERVAGRGGAPATQEAPKVTVSSVIKAEWPLKADSSEAMLLAASAIKDQIKASKVLDMPKAPMSEAEEEAAMMAAADGGAASPDEPFYTYVAKLSDDEQTKAMADAFGKAKGSAQRLAKAAGSDLGALRSIEGQVTADPEEAYNMRQYGNSSYYRQMMLQRYGSGGSDDKEAIGTQPGKVTVQVVVQASFAIK